MDNLRCIIERITYQNEDNGYTVLKCRAKGYSDLVTVVGIMPDVYVPIDTTRASDLFIACNRKATQMRFASWMFDTYTEQLRTIESFDEMNAFLKKVGIVGRFRDFARTRDGITATEKVWEETLPYLEPQLNALVARYSKLGDNAFYKYYLPIDETVNIAVTAPARPR